MFFDDLDVRLMLSTAFIFLMLIWILNSILYKPLLAFMAKRDEGIKNDEAKIRQGNTDAINNEALVAKIYADARAKAQVIKSESINLAKTEADKILNDKKNVLEEEYKNFLIELEAQKEIFKEELRKNIFSLDEVLNKSIYKL